MCIFYKGSKEIDVNTINNLLRVLDRYVSSDDAAIVVDFITIAAANDRRYRIENGGGIKYGPFAYSRKGKTISLKRRASYYATEIKKAIFAARRAHSDFWTVALRVNSDGDLVDPELSPITWAATRGRNWAEIEIKPGAVVFRASATAIASTTEEGNNGERN